MRPFILGGRAVFCRKLNATEIADLTPGDIIWFKTDEQGLRIHRLVAKVLTADGTPTMITRGDPMVVAESVPCHNVLGVALYAEVENSAVISLTKGFLTCHFEEHFQFLGSPISFSLTGSNLSVFDTR